MKRALMLATLLLSAAGYVFLQTTPPSPKLATLMPSGGLLCLESADFAHLLRDWDASKVKADWLKSANYAVFSRSNLFTKLQEVYSQYGAAAGYEPGLKSVIQIAGTDSALALYEIRDVEFLYVSRIADADFMKSQLWAVRNKFEQRQAGGLAFYLRADPASKRTVAFALAKGYLLLATRDDLVAQALELIGGGANPSIASDRWYRDSTAAAPNPGELRLVMNLEPLVKSVYFRSYWIQRNASMVRQYWAGVADMRRDGGNITETRVFLRTPEAVESMRAAIGSGTVSSLLALVPPEAGLYKASRAGESSEVAALLVQKLIGPQPAHSRDWREAPSAVSPDSRAGNEGDLETRIDEQPLPSDAGVSGSIAAVKAMVDKSGARSLLLVQSSAPPSGTFVQMPSVMVIDAAQDWDRDSVRKISRHRSRKVVDHLPTRRRMGERHIVAATVRTPGRPGNVGLQQSRTTSLRRQRLESTLGPAFDRAGTNAAAGDLTYAAGFRHLRERPSYERVMAALDFTSPAGNSAQADGSGAATGFLFGKHRQPEPGRLKSGGDSRNGGAEGRRYVPNRTVSERAIKI